MDSWTLLTESPHFCRWNIHPRNTPMLSWSQVTESNWLKQKWNLLVYRHKHPREKHGFRRGWIQSSNSTWHGCLPPLSWLPSQNLKRSEHNMMAPAPASVRAEVPPSVPQALQHSIGSGRVMWPSLVGANGLRWLSGSHMLTTGPSFHSSNRVWKEEVVALRTRNKSWKPIVALLPSDA